MHFKLKDLSQIDSTLLDLLTKNLPDMLWIKNLNGTYKYANKAICDGLLMAKDTEEPIGKDDVFFALREREKNKDNPNWHTFGELCFNSDQIVIDANKAMKFEEYGNVKGKLLYLEVNKAPFYDEDGNIIGTVGSGRDITKLKITQFKLSEQAQIIEQIHDCIITTDIKGKIVSWNRSAKKLFNYTKNEVINKNINILFIKENHKKIKNYIDILFEKGKSSTKIDFLSKSKETIITDLTLSLLKDKDEKIIRIIYYIKDITDKEKLNEEIKKQENIITNQAHHVSMGEMIGNIAHQWRQPLSVISAASTGLLIQKELNTITDEILTESCKAIERNTQYLSDTIDDFRSFIKGDRSKTLFNLTTTIESFLKLMESTVKKYHIRIILDLEKNIIIDGYSNDLMQCLINIFNNSKDAFLENKIENSFIFIKSSKSNNKVEISFKDNAKGIPKEILPKVFDPYFTTKYKEKGTGLGLYMTYKIITEGMIGKIKVGNIKYKYNNQNHTGAEFNILLPL
jgi:PAS domain S-box-containing protein